MKVNELRIRDYVTAIERMNPCNGDKDWHEIVTVKSIDEEEIGHDAFGTLGNLSSSLSNIEPILLTDEWLTKLPSFSFGENFRCWLQKIDGEIKVVIEQYGEGEEILEHIKYVHQYQNLYLDLTGYELI